MVEDEINLFDYWNIIVKRKKLIFVITSIITVTSIFYSLFLPKIYRAECTLMPVGGHVGSGGLLLAQQAFAQVGGGSLEGLIGSTTNDASSQILAIMNSKTLAERVIEKMDLFPVLYPNLDKSKKTPTLVEAVETLQNLIRINDDKKSKLITIQILMKDPKAAAMIANGYLDELINYMSESTFTSAKRNRFFIEKQLERNKIELLNSGRELSSFYATNKISNVVPSLDVDVSTQSGKVLLENSEEKLDKAIDEPAQLQAELEATTSQLRQAHIVKDVPQQVYLQYLIIQRELLGKLNILLSQQYEMAKIDEAKEDLSFQIIDRARVPVKKCKPKRAQIVMISFVMSIFLGIFYAFFREYLEKMKSHQATV